MAEQPKQPQIAVAEAIHLLQTFRGSDLTQTIYQIEKSLKGVSAQNYSAVLNESVGPEFMEDVAGYYSALVAADKGDLKPLQDRIKAALS